jgi:predicted nucleotidyltransferase
MSEIKPVQSMNEIRKRCALLLNDRECEPICWAGVYGSFSRSKHTPDSDVDMIIGYKSSSTPDEVYLAAGGFVQEAPDAFGRQVEAIHMMTHKVETYLLLEALLTCVTVYGPDNWPEKSKEDARKYLDEGFRRLKEAYELLQELQDQIDKTTKDVRHVDGNITIEVHQ